MEETGDVAMGRALPVSDGCSTSWTAQKKISRDFSQPEHRARGWAVTLIADVEANKTRFLAGPGGLYDVRGLSRWHREKESVGLEPIVVRRAQWERLQAPPVSSPSPVAEPAET